MLCHSVRSCHWSFRSLNFSLVARLKLATGVPLAEYLTSGSLPTFPTRMTLFTLLGIAASCDVRVVRKRSCGRGGRHGNGGCIRKVFQARTRRGPLRRVPGRRNQPLLRPWRIGDRRTQSLSWPDVVDTRQQPQPAACCQQLASHERPKDASPIRARDRPGESPSSRGLAGRVETEPFVPLHRSPGRGDEV